MEGELIVGLVAVVGLILVPSLAIAVRLSLKPTVEAVLLLREALAKRSTATVHDPDDTRARLAQLEAAVGELQESTAFYRELRASESATHALPYPNSAVGADLPSR